MRSFAVTFGLLALTLTSAVRAAHHLPGEIPRDEVGSFFPGVLDSEPQGHSHSHGESDNSGFVTSGGNRNDVEGVTFAEPTSSTFSPSHNQADVDLFNVPDPFNNNFLSQDQFQFQGGQSQDRNLGQSNQGQGHSHQNHGQTSSPRPQRPASKPKRDCRPFQKRRLLPHGGNVFFLSWRENLQESWKTAKNFCEAYCMDLVSLDSKKHAFLARHMAKDYVYGFWTGGKLCSKGKKCSRYPHWFWTASKRKIDKTNWSNKGGMYEPQPDNLSERFYGPREECLAVLNNWYRDGIKWHDLVCEDRMPFVCEAKVNRPSTGPSYGTQGQTGRGGYRGQGQGQRQGQSSDY